MDRGPWRPLLARIELTPGRVAGILGASTVSIAAGATAPILVRRVVDAVPEADSGGALAGAGGYLVAVVLASLASAAAARVAVAVGHDALHRVRTDAYRALLTGDDAPHDAQARLTRDVDALADVTVDFGPWLLRESFGAVAGFVALLALAPEAALLSLFMVPGAGIAGRWMLRRSHAVYGSERETVGAVNRNLVETVTGSDTLGALGRRQWAMARQRTHDDQLIDAVRRGTEMRNRFYPALILLGGAVTAAVLLVCALQASSGRMSVGSAVAAVYALSGVLGPMVGLAAGLDRLLNARAALVRVGEILPPGEARLAPVELTGAAPVHVERVGFGYGPVPVLRDLTLTVPAGQLVVLVGASGSGKSTFFALLAGLLRPQCGEATVASQDPCDLAPGRVALVAQHELALPGTVAENIAVAAPGLDRGGIEGAILALGLDGWLRELPDGLETRATAERPWSTRDLEAMALARALLLDPPVVLLDEATTALTDDEEARVLATLRRGRTVLLACHRPSALGHADVIAVLHGGRVVARGSHPHLLDTCPPYRHWLGV